MYRVHDQCQHHLARRAEHDSDGAVADQVALAGFSNFSAPELFDPSLTTVKQPAFEMGKTAVELLLGLIESKHKTTKLEMRVLPTELLV